MISRIDVLRKKLLSTAFFSVEPSLRASQVTVVARCCVVDWIIETFLNVIIVRFKGPEIFMLTLFFFKWVKSYNWLFIECLFFFLCSERSTKAFKNLNKATHEWMKSPFRMLKNVDRFLAKICTNATCKEESNVAKLNTWPNFLVTHAIYFSIISNSTTLQTTLVREVKWQTHRLHILEYKELSHWDLVSSSGYSFNVQLENVIF